MSFIQKRGLSTLIPPKVRSQIHLQQDHLANHSI
jgi:hypothetical protein